MLSKVPGVRIFMFFTVLLSLALSFIETHYDVLGVSLTATKKEIKSAYRELVIKLHPDKINKQGLTEIEIHSINEKFLSCQAAYETLYDSEKRLEYDNLLAGDENNPNRPIIIEPERYMRGNFHLQAETSDFSFHFHASYTSETLIPEIIHQIKVPLHEVYSADLPNITSQHERNLTYFYHKKCPFCNGTGGLNGECTLCKVCRGSGKALHRYEFGDDGDSGDLHNDSCQNDVANEFNISDCNDEHIGNHCNNSNHYNIHNKNNDYKNHYYIQNTTTTCGHCNGKGCVVPKKCNHCGGDGTILTEGWILAEVPTTGFTHKQQFVYPHMGHDFVVKPFSLKCSEVCAGENMTNNGATNSSTNTASNESDVSQNIGETLKRKHTEGDIENSTNSSGSSSSSSNTNSNSSGNSTHNCSIPSPQEIRGNVVFELLYDFPTGFSWDAASPYNLEYNVTVLTSDLLTRKNEANQTLEYLFASPVDYENIKVSIPLDYHTDIDGHSVTNLYTTTLTAKGLKYTDLKPVTRDTTLDDDANGAVPGVGTEENGDAHCSQGRPKSTIMRGDLVLHMEIVWGHSDNEDDENSDKFEEMLSTFIQSEDLSLEDELFSRFSEITNLIKQNQMKK